MKNAPSYSTWARSRKVVAQSLLSAIPGTVAGTHLKRTTGWRNWPPRGGAPRVPRLPKLPRAAAHGVAAGSIRRPRRHDTGSQLRHPVLPADYPSLPVPGMAERGERIGVGPNQGRRVASMMTTGVSGTAAIFEPSSMVKFAVSTSSISWTTFWPSITSPNTE